jgi:putative ABC transport system permease protein
MNDVWMTAGFIAVAAVVSLVPALLALRVSAATALRS